MIDIIIVNWNSGSQLTNAMLSIDRYHHGLVSSVIIVDNASVDDSLERVAKMQNNALTPRIIRNVENIGFGKACNLGARQVKSNYILFLNPDAALYDDTLPKAFSFLEQSSNANIGICGVQLLDESSHVSRHCARFPNSLGFVAHAIGLDRFFPSLGHVMSEWDHTQIQKVDHVIGAFFLVRRDLFDALSGFDERFFVYLEDLDFSLRARKVGWHCVYLADVQAFHAGGGTSNQIKARRLFYSLRSRLVYSFKHFSRVGAILVMLTTLVVEPASRLSHALLRRSWSAFKETLVAYGLLGHWLLQLLLNKEE